MLHVPYKGVTQALIAMTSGEVDTVVMPVSTALPQIKASESPDVRAKPESMSVFPWPGSPKELAGLVRRDMERYGAVVRAANVPKQ